MFWVCGGLYFGGGGDLYMNGVGIFVGNFEINFEGVWLFECGVNFFDFWKRLFENIDKYELSE